MDGDALWRRLQALAAYHHVLAALARRLGVGDDAEDIASDAVLLTALRGRVHTDEPLPYLQRVVRNLVVDRFREWAHQQRPDLCAGTSPWQPAIDDEIAARDLAHRVLCRLRATEGPVTAWLVWRRLVDGLSWQDLATEVGLSVSSVQSRVWRAVQRLRPWLARQLDLN